jgi:hypothetical protein
MSTSRLQRLLLELLPWRFSGDCASRLLLLLHHLAGLLPLPLCQQHLRHAQLVSAQRKRRPAPRLPRVVLRHSRCHCEREWGDLGAGCCGRSCCRRRCRRRRGCCSIGICA